MEVLEARKINTKCDSLSYFKYRILYENSAIIY